MLRPSRPSGFTLIELLTVMVIILVLAGLVISLVGYAQNKGSLARAQVEIAAMSSALESYRADNGAYPSSNYTNMLNAKNSASGGDPTTYPSACATLYQALSGNAQGTSTGTYGKTYYDKFPPNSSLPTDSTTGSYYVLDPFGNSYGYSTIYQNELNNPASGSGSGSPSPTQPQDGYNPTYDLWSTGGYSKNGKAYPSDLTTATAQSVLWVKNW